MFTSQQKEILEGLMLGDGYIPKPAKNGNAYLSVERKAQDSKYLLHHAEIFSEYLGDKGVTTRTRTHPKTNHQHQSIILRTKQNENFGELYKRWYQIGKKTIPNDLNLTPLTVATWFADDGSISVHKKYDNLLILKFSTHGFTKQEVESLQSKLQITYQVPFLLTEEKKNQFIIRLCKTQDVKNFLRKIDSVFPISMSRKSDKWRSESFQLWKDETYTPFIFEGKCIKCSSTSIWKYSKINDNQRYRCKHCGKQFFHNDSTRAFLTVSA